MVIIIWLINYIYCALKASKYWGLTVIKYSIMIIPSQHVSKACMMVYGQDKRDAFIKGMIAHREMYPVIKRKKYLIN